MPLMNILVLMGITTMFVVFAAVLAWGDHQTRHLTRNFGQTPARRWKAGEPVMPQIQFPEARGGEKLVVASTKREKVNV